MDKNEFGGSWTLIKLELLRKYLEAYAKVFKSKPFNLIYLDAFAGSGKCYTKVGLIDGSARIALGVERFNEYIFIENNPEFVENLKELKKEFPNKKITIIQGDCNEEINSIIKSYDWSKNRALGFLDPFNMQLSFDTLKKLASTRAFDVWYLFPLHAATRCLRTDGKIQSSVQEKLDYLFGSNNWKERLYIKNPQLSLFNEENFIRKGQSDICCFFKEEMERIFPSVLCPVCLKNKNNTPLFLLYFAVSNNSKAAQYVANKIAGYLISNERTYVCRNPLNMI